MTRGKKRSLAMLVLSVPMFLASMTFVVVLLFSRAIYPLPAVIAATCLVSILCIGSTIRDSATADD